MKFQVVRKCPVCDAEFTDLEYSVNAQQSVSDLQDEALQAMEEADKVLLSQKQIEAEIIAKKHVLEKKEKEFKNIIRDEFKEDLEFFKNIRQLLRTVYDNSPPEYLQDRTQRFIFQQTEKLLSELETKMKKNK